MLFIFFILTYSNNSCYGNYNLHYTLLYLRKIWRIIYGLPSCVLSRRVGAEKVSCVGLWAGPSRLVDIREIPLIGFYICISRTTSLSSKNLDWCCRGINCLTYINKLSNKNDTKLNIFSSNQTRQQLILVSILTFLSWRKIHKNMYSQNHLLRSVFVFWRV